MDFNCAVAWPLPALAVGSCLIGRDLEQFVTAHAVRAIVDLRAEERHDLPALRRLGVQLLYLPTPDCCAVSSRALRRGVAWTNRRIDEGERVFVHCQYGIGRSALLAACVLVSRGLSASAALRALKQARPVVSPSQEQLLALLRFARSQQPDHGAANGESIEDLTRIAWSGVAEAAQSGTLASSS